MFAWDSIEPFNDRYLTQAAEFGAVNSPVGALVPRQIIVFVPFVYAQLDRVTVHYLSAGHPRKGNRKVRVRRTPVQKNNRFLHVG